MPHNPKLLKTERFYYIYTRGNNSCKIFIHDKNYSYFKSLMKKYLIPICNCLEYSLLENEIHIIIQTFNKKEILHFQKIMMLNKLTPEKRISQQISNMLNAYTKAFNKKYNRTGSLFEHPFHKKEIIGNVNMHRKTNNIHLLSTNNNFSINNNLNK